MAADIANRVEKLRQACDEAFHMYPKSCSHAVWHVIQQYKTNQPYMMANALQEYLQQSHEWQLVTLTELSELANEGTLVVGGLNQSPNGHVIVVHPGLEKTNGGFSFQDKTTGENKVVRKSGVYALAMSTTMGSWPGAKSNGEKTVRDPWGKDSTFLKVRFWKYIGPTDNALFQHHPQK